MGWRADRRLRSVQRHMHLGGGVGSLAGAPRDRLPANAAGAAPEVPTGGAVDTELLAHHLGQLQRDGVTILEDVYAPGQVAEWQAALTDVWEPL
jgi:hypothetical protein